MLWYTGMPALRHSTISAVQPYKRMHSRAASADTQQSLEAADNSLLCVGCVSHSVTHSYRRNTSSRSNSDGSSGIYFRVSTSSSNGDNVSYVSVYDSECTFKISSCKSTAAFYYLGLFFAIVSAIPFWTMCCCSSPPVRPQLQLDAWYTTHLAALQRSAI